jgi:hypothetical protein
MDDRNGKRMKRSNSIVRTAKSSRRSWSCCCLPFRPPSHSFWLLSALRVFRGLGFDVLPLLAQTALGEVLHFRGRGTSVRHPLVTDQVVLESARRRDLSAPTGARR